VHRVVYGSVASSALAKTPVGRKSPFGLRTAKKASLRGFDFEQRDGYLYVAVRAVSSRVNQNYDGFSPEELRRCYATFVGRPIFINHENTDIRRARGVIKDAILHDEDPRDVWVEVLHELDAVTYPKLCAAIASGDIDTTSMGCNISHSVCSISTCRHEARFPSEFCVHMKNKGQVFEVKTASGGVESVLAYEDCRGVNFFEDSWVVSPADTSAVTKGILLEGVEISL
jgi:hypothetical protein